jgi:hypothetical protein
MIMVRKGTKSGERTLDYLAIVAILSAVIGLVMFIKPAPIGEGKFFAAVNGIYDPPCNAGEEQVITETGTTSSGQPYTHWYCYRVAPFSPNSLPISGAFFGVSLLLLVLRLRPVNR